MPAILSALLMLLVLFGARPALAQGSEGSSASTGGSFITPFPENETYRLQVIGEGMAEGLLGGLLEALSKEPRLLITRKHRQLASLFRGDIAEEMKGLEAEFAREAPHIAVVMPNMFFRFPWREQLDRRFPPNSEARSDEIERRRSEWKVQVGARIDRLLQIFRRKNVAVYWVGLPIMKNQFTSDDAQAINELVRERAYVNGVKFIDIYSGFAGEGGGFSAEGPDLDGKMRILREQDGVQFSQAGSRKLAHFVERELKRDLTQARTERTIPLAGTEVEQKRIRPANLAAPAATPIKGSPANVSKDGRPPARDAAASRAATESGGGDVRADNSRITMKSVSLQGKEENVTIDILRPSIPATVLAVVTRRESADKPSQVGDAVTTEIAGGQTVISSVTPMAETGGDRRRSPGANSPYSLVLEKGERLPPKPGRSDDMPWPRIETPPQAKAERTVPAPVRAQPPGAKAPAPVKGQPQPRG